MRILCVLILFCLIFMSLQTCEGCAKTYRNLANHVKTCSKMHTFIGGGLRQRMDNTSRAEAAQRAEHARIQEEQERARAEAARQEAERRAREEVRTSLPFLHAC